MPNPIQPVQPGDPRRIGPYRVIGRVGAGGMGAVYAAVDASGLRLAVKVVHPAQAGDEEFRSRFRREVQLCRRVNGPCLVSLHDADTESSTPWLATPFVPGPTLDQFLATGGPLQGAQLYALAAGTAAALAAVHEAGVVHRDVKPQNVILSPAGPRVVDFGIAHALEGTSVTRTGVMTGTPGWISPEHYRTGEVGVAGDVFAWGALVAYSATGRLPFGKGAPDAVAFRVMSNEADLDGVPDDLHALIERALAKDPDGRPTATDLSRSCTALLAAQATAATPRTESATLISDLVSIHWDLPLQNENTAPWRAAPRHRSARLYLSVAAAALIVGGTAGAIAAASSSDSEQNRTSGTPHSRPTTTFTQPTTRTTVSPESSSKSKTAAEPFSTPSPAPALPTTPSPAYTRTDPSQPSIEEWSGARIPATPAEKAAAQQIRKDAGAVLKGLDFLDDDVSVTFNPQAQTMFVTFGPGIYPEGQSYHDDPNWTDVTRALMFGGCTEAQRHFHDNITWPYGRAAVVYRESMASPTIANFREITHSDACRV
ncbi:protein kinase domain-containing protein [Streptomyces sp. NPDC054888]